MKLANPFPLRVRLLYLDCWTCWMCEENGQRSGGLEIHHITGRDSDSAFNSSCLCKKCHTVIEHTQEREAELFLKTLKYLYNLEYEPNMDDFDFIRSHPYLVTTEVAVWLDKLS